jgi:hypothetical protein
MRTGACSEVDTFLLPLLCTGVHIMYGWYRHIAKRQRHYIINIMSTRIRFLLSLLVFIIAGGAGALSSQQQQECEVDTDGNCVTDNNNSCVDNHEKCQEWSDTGKQHKYVTLVDPLFNCIGLLNQTDKISL